MTDLEVKNKYFEPDKDSVNLNGIVEKDSIDKMEEDVHSAELNRVEKTISVINDRLNTEKMEEDVLSNEFHEATKSCTNVNDIEDKQLSNGMGDQLDTSKCFGHTQNVSCLINMQILDARKEYDDEVVSEMDVIENQTDTELVSMKNSLLDSVAKSDGFFKSQQVGESDLTFSEKREIASDLLIRSLPLFLQRYWSFIKIEDVPYFDAHRSNYEVNFYVNEIMKVHNTKTKKVRIKNRRYEALKRMVDERSYFTDAEMKKRNPFLYDQMIGQHLTEKERVDAYKEQYPDKNFSAFLLDQMEKNIENCLFEKQKNEDEAIVEEEDDDSEEDESELEDDIPVKKVVTDIEKKQLRSEFTNIMYESFLDGKDKDFDYGSVDNNVDFDSIQQRDIDEQEKYFDEESSHSSN